MDIKPITIDAKGKTREEIKKELLDEVEKQFEQTFKKVEIKKELSYLHIAADETKDGKGFNCSTDCCGGFDEIAQMLNISVTQVLKGFAEDNDSSYSELLMAFIATLLVGDTMEEEED